MPLMPRSQKKVGKMTPSRCEVASRRDGGATVKHLQSLTATARLWLPQTGHLSVRGKRPSGLKPFLKLVHYLS